MFGIINRQIFQKGQNCDLSNFGEVHVFFLYIILHVVTEMNQQIPWFPRHPLLVHCLQWNLTEVSCDPIWPIKGDINANRAEPVLILYIIAKMVFECSTCIV